jgi:hypothetical protein
MWEERGKGCELVVVRWSGADMHTRGRAVGLTTRSQGLTYQTDEVRFAELF